MAGLKGRRRENHGMYKSPEYINWRGMNERCRNPNAAHYKRYGGRGISVCKEWQDSFMAFYDYMGPRPSPGMTIERIDNDGNYEPGNVRWATRREQVANRNLTTYNLDGNQLTIAGIASHIDVHRRIIDTLVNRGHEMDEIVEDIVFNVGRLYNPKPEGFTSVDRYVTHDGETMSLSQFSDRYNVSYSKLHKLIWRRKLPDQLACDIVLGRQKDPVHVYAEQGERYGSLVVSSNTVERVNGKRRVRCDCDCGTTNVSVDLYSLVYGKRTHCGCQRVRTWTRKK